MAESNDPEEKDFFISIVRAFRQYKNLMQKCVTNTEEYVLNLPQHQQILLRQYSKNLGDVRECVEQNQIVFNKILEGVHHMFENVDPDYLEGMTDSSTQDLVTKDEIEKVKTIIKQLYREWSEDGSAERISCFKPVLDTIQTYFPPDKCTAANINILVPGAGLGRLPFEIASLGYSCEGNEFSLYMLITSNFLLNRYSGPNSLTVYPWVHHFSNHININSQTTPVTFPDVDPSILRNKIQSFSMSAGDFTEIYKIDNEWDCIVTCFFVDCSPNIIDVVETIFTILKPGGIWINIGPLMYHFSVLQHEAAVSITYRDLFEIITAVGFQFEKEEICVKTSYCQNPASMLKSEYESVFFVCRKPTPNTQHDNRPTHSSEKNCNLTDTVNSS